MKQDLAWSPATNPSTSDNLLTEVCALILRKYS